MPSHQSTIYKGRFAPSPTGPVHFGTLVTAVGSYLQAKKNNGEWIVRMEDVDTTRKVAGADVDILNTLAAYGFEWHGEVIYQSKQSHHYQQALEQLISQSLIFPCLCSRKQLAETDSDIYPGTCRQQPLPEKNQHALRIIAENIDIAFVDAVMDKQSQNIKQQCGDFILKRRDGLFAYQLAVVVDDALQGISEVVRGADLLEVTARQIYLQQLLYYPTPDYCHLPLVIDDAGNKISKSEGAATVGTENKVRQLISALKFLGQQPPDELNEANISELWKWSIDHWRLDRVAKNNQLLPTLIV